MGRMLIAERPGRVDVVPVGSSTPQQVLDISDHVNAYGERGLLSLAVDSAFAKNHFVYFLYTYDVTPRVADSGGPMASRLTRIELNTNNTAGAETVLLGEDSTSPCPETPANDLDCIPSDSDSHSIGTVLSDTGGTLWVSSGDGSGYGFPDPRAFRAYDTASPAGKILHIDRNGNGLPGHPFCPSDTDLDDVCTKVYASGLRNPFRFTIAPSGDLLVGDVGWSDREEIDLIGPRGRQLWLALLRRVDPHAAVPGPGRVQAAERRVLQRGHGEGRPRATLRLPAQPRGIFRSSGRSGPVLGDEYPAGYWARSSTVISTEHAALRLQRNGGLMSAPFAHNWDGVGP